MKIALDTNILAYAEGVDDIVKQNKAHDLIKKLPQNSIYLPIQVLGELFNVLSRKTPWSPAKIRETILNWRDSSFLIPTYPDVMLAAIDLAADHQIPIWDATLLAATARASCRLLLSEDFQDGFTWSGVTVVNPFSSTPNPLLTALLESRAS